MWLSGNLRAVLIESRGELHESRAWSTMKVPVIVAAIAAGRADWDAIEAAITRSDNDAALRLWDRLDDGAAEVEAVLRRAGDDHTRLEREPDPRGYSSFGRTVWSLTAAVTFYGALARGELLPDEDTGRVLDAMGRIVPDQRWGLGAAPGNPLQGRLGAERGAGRRLRGDPGRNRGLDRDRDRGTGGGLRGREAASLEACAATSEHSITSSPLPPRTRSARPRSSTSARSAASSKPSQANTEAFERAVDEVAAVSTRLLGELVTNAPPKDREVEAAKAKARSAARYAA